MKKLYQSIRYLFHISYNKRLSTIAGALSFFFVLSIVPMAFLSFYIVNIFINNIGLINDIRLEEFLNFDLTSPVSIFFMLTTMYSASKLFFHFKRSGELIFNYKDETKSLMVRIISILNMLIFVFILALGITFYILIKKYLSNNSWRWLFIILVFVLFSTFLFFSLLALNRYVSNNKQKLIDYYRGALFTIGFDIIISIGFGIYVGYFADYSFLYSYLASIVIGLLYVYLLMLGLVYGFLINTKYIKQD